MNESRQTINLAKTKKRNLLLDRMSIKISFLSLNAKQICYKSEYQIFVYFRHELILIKDKLAYSNIAISIYVILMSLKQ